MTTPLVLASGSPRRRQLLALLGVEFTAVAPDVDETPADGEAPTALVRRLAVAKADAVDGSAVLAADTVVELDGAVLGKPVDAGDARRMLALLSGRTHRVHTGVALRSTAGIDVDVVTTDVTMTPITPVAAEWYVGTGEPLDKAGAYGMQGAGGVFVEHIRGSASNVVGLPLATVAAMLGRHGLWRR